MTYIKKNEFFIGINKGKDTRISAKCIQRDNEYYTYIQYCNTIIVKIDYKKDILILNTDGWYSRTTKRYINNYIATLGLYIQQYDFNWYIIKDNNSIQGKKDLKAKLESGDIIEYKDGIIIPLH